MKIDRHLAILNLLTEYGTITAPYLAEKLEVSRRTINRDIEDLCKAGIPIMTKQGNNGGISLMEGYKIDKTVLKKNDMESILTALDGLNSVVDSENINTLLLKLEQNGVNNISDRTMMIDLASHYKPSLSRKISKLRTAITGNQVVDFQYFGPAGKSVRHVEPYKIIFRWSEWYLYGFCQTRHDFRLFKLNRLWNLELNGNTFSPRQASFETTAFDGRFDDPHPFEAMFTKDTEYLIVETYGPGSYTETDQGLHFKGSYTNLDFITRWLLGFGNRVTVLNPPDLVQHLQKEK